MENDWSKIIELFELHDFLLVKAPDRVLKNALWNHEDGNRIKFGINEYACCCLHEDGTFTSKLDGKVIKVIKEDFVISNQLRLVENKKDFDEICRRELKKYNISEKDERSFLVYLIERLKQLINKHENNIEYERSHYNCLFMAKYFIKHIETKISPLDQINVNELQWYGSKTELIELTKALIENGNLKGKQEDIFIAVQKTFNIELKNIDQAITKFNSRNQENETKFLDTLKTSLSQYIKTKLEKKR